MFDLDTRPAAATGSAPTSPPKAIDTARNKEIGYKAQYELLVDRDMGAIDRYWGDYYLQHNPNLRDGIPELKLFKSTNVPKSTTEIVRCIADRDLVFYVLRVEGLADHDVCFFDLYRLENGKIVEHWDAYQDSKGANPAGRTMFDGPVKIEHPEQTEATREVVTGLVSRVFIMEQFEKIEQFVAPDVAQYGPGMEDGIDGMRDHYLKAQWFTGAITYTALRRVIAEGEYAVTASDGEIGGVPYVFYDLFRVIEGKVVDHWTLTEQSKKSAFHTHPMV